MSNAYDELSQSVDRSQVAAAVREIVKSLMEEREITYKKLARRVSNIVNLEITDGSIRLFLADEQRSRVNAGNTTLRALYNFIVDDHHHFPGATNARFFELREKLGLLAPPAVDDAVFAIGTHRWVHASKTDVARLHPKLEGRFVVIRRSTVNAKYIKSLLQIKFVRSSDHRHVNHYLKAEHHHFDRSQKLRIAAGFAFPVVRNIYMAMQVEGHEGLEIIVVRDPVQNQPDFFMGFMLGLNGNRNIYNSSVLIERLSSKNQHIWDKISNRFSGDHPRLKDLGKDFSHRLKQVISESRSQLLSRFDDDDDPDER